MKDVVVVDLFLKVEATAVLEFAVAVVLVSGVELGLLTPLLSLFSLECATGEGCAVLN